MVCLDEEVAVVDGDGSLVSYRIMNFNHSNRFAWARKRFGGQSIFRKDGATVIRPYYGLGSLLATIECPVPFHWDILFS